MYENIDGVAMSSPLGPLMVNVFMCSVEEKLKRENTLPTEFLQKISGRDASFSTWPFRLHWIAYYSKWSPSSIQFTAEAAANNRLPFIGMETIKVDHRPETCVYRRKTNKGPGLRESRYKGRSLLGTMLDCAKPCRLHWSSFRKNI